MKNGQLQEVKNKMDIVRIQVQNITGTWFDISTVRNNDQMIRLALDSAQKNYNKRVRAIDSKGTIVDIRN